MNKHNARNQKTSRYIMGVTPTPERQRQLGGLRRKFIKADGVFTQRYRACWASPLDLYRDKQVIDGEQHQAGLRFGRAYHHAVSSELACHERNRRIDNPEMATMSASWQQALDYVDQAFAALSLDTIGVMIDVCAYERPATTPEALGKLRKGLKRLALEWGMAATEMCQCRKS